MNIYVVEDDESILKLVEYALQSKGYQVKTFERGGLFFNALKEEKPDLVLLDIMLPDIDGIEILKRMKSDPENQKIWTMMITAKNTEYDIISALDHGADDYLKKPFSVLELLSRINAMKRRMEPSHRQDRQLIFQGITLDLLSRQVWIDKKEKELRYKEFELLKYLMENQDIVLTRDRLLQRIWGYDYQGETRTVDMHIKRLRDLLEEKRKYIKTIRGVGYMFSGKE